LILGESRIQRFLECFSKSEISGASPVRELGKMWYDFGVEEASEFDDCFGI